MEKTMSITDNLTMLLESKQKDLEKNTEFLSLEKAAIEFDLLVTQGIIKRRGYTLMTMDKAHLHILPMNMNSLS
jgi:hypothetical protein